MAVDGGGEQPFEGYPPDNLEVRRHIEHLAARHPDRVQIRTLGYTEQGRSLDQVLITDPRSPAENKQHVLVAAGQHGNEESARLVALRLMDHLLSSDGRPTLNRQLIAILP